MTSELLGQRAVDFSTAIWLEIFGIIVNFSLASRLTPDKLGMDGKQIY